MAFADILRQLREERQLSQKDIAGHLGITRQAVALYELGKREPDYRILKTLADFFGVSVDYLLGRTGCREINAVTVGKNIGLVRGKRSYKELSEDISKKMGAYIGPDMLELYEKGERLPFIGTLKILAKYAGVRESFFYVPNTKESYLKEKGIYRIEIGTEKHDEDADSALCLYWMDEDTKRWVQDSGNIKYIKIAKEIQENGVACEAVRALLNMAKELGIEGTKKDDK